MRRGEIRRRECEDFAPRDGGIRASGERGAKRGSRRELGRAKSGGGNVKILLPGTEAQEIAGSGEQRAEAARRLRGQNQSATAGRRPPTDSLELRESKSGPALAARFCFPSYLIFMPGSREPCSVLHLGNPVRYRRVPAERYRGLRTGSGNLPP